MKGKKGKGRLTSEKENKGAALGRVSFGPDGSQANMPVLTKGRLGRLLPQIQLRVAMVTKNNSKE